MQQATPTKQTSIKVPFKAFEVLKRNNNELPSREVISQIGKELKLNAWEKERYEKSGYIRWQSILHFYTIDAIKAGYMVKKNGIWFLTDEGVKAMKLGAEGLFDNVIQEYKKWKSSQPIKEQVGAGNDEIEVTMNKQG